MRAPFSTVWLLLAAVSAGGCVQSRHEVAPASAAPTVSDPLTEAQVVQIAKREAERRKIPVQEFKGPFVDQSFLSSNKWFVWFWRENNPADHFSIEINDRTGATRFWGAE
jgi:hypothetical protein